MYMKYTYGTGGKYFGHGNSGEQNSRLWIFPLNYIKICKGFDCEKPNSPVC